MKKLLSFLVPAFVLAAIAATTISTTQSVIRNGFTTSNGVMQAGLSASAGGSNAIAIGVGTDASKSNSIAIGLNALSRGYGSLAVGAGSTAGLNASNSFAVGPGATVTAADSGVLGVANTAVSVPGTLSVANTLSVGSGSSNPGGIVMASTNGFTSALLSSMQVTNVTWMEETNANNGLSWSTNVSGGSGGTVTNQRVRIPDGTSGQHLVMGSAGPTWQNLATSFDIPTYDTTNTESGVAVTTGGTTLTAWGNAVVNVQGAGMAPVRGSNGIPRFLPITNSPSSFFTSVSCGGGSGNDMDDTDNICATYLFRINAPLNSNYIWACHSTALPGTTVAPSTTFGFRFVSVFTNDNFWAFYSNDGITLKTNQSAISVSTNVWYCLTYQKLGSNIYYYINGTNYWTNNYLPSASTGVGHSLQLRTANTAITNSSIERLDFVKTKLRSIAKF